jgi:hypothetical protein
MAWPQHKSFGGGLAFRLPSTKPTALPSERAGNIKASALNALLHGRSTASLQARQDVRANRPVVSPKVGSNRLGDVMAANLSG